MSKWRNSLYEALKAYDAPRVASYAELLEYAKGVDETVTPRKLDLFIEHARQFDIISQVRRGLFINKSVSPIPILAEAARRIRTGAIVSLQTVLGDAGVLNNFTSQIYCVLPMPDGGQKPNLGSIDAGGTIFHFKGIKQSILEAGDPWDRIAPMLPYDRATPEAAIVHWHYLASVQRSQMVEPDTQCDMEHIDIERLERLAAAANLKDQVLDWVERCHNRQQMDDEQMGWGHP